MYRRTALAATAGALSASGCLGLGEPSQSDDGRLDASGSIEVAVDGEPVDLTRDRFQAEHADHDALAFHLHEDSEEWYMEGERRVTVAQAVERLPAFGYDERDGWRALTVDGTTYDERDAGIETATFVNGSLVDPEAYRLHDGDELRIELTTDAAVRREPAAGRVDATGTLDVLVDGDPIDFSDDRFQAEHVEDESLAFHFHDGSEEWYSEGEARVTFGRGLDLLPHVSYERTEGAHVLAVDGDHYDERDAGTELAFTLGGDLVTPTACELGDGDELRVLVTTNA